MKVLDDALFMLISVSIATVNKYGEKDVLFSCLKYKRSKHSISLTDYH